MKKIIIITLSILTVLFLFNNCKSTGSDTSTSLKSEDITDNSLFHAKVFWYKIAQTCEGYPSKENCDDGDMALFNGLGCLAGEKVACKGVKNSQDSDGRWWRSPRRKGNNLGEKNSFSRDQTLGVFAYLIKTKDVEAAKRWLKWIEKNRACSIVKPDNLGGGCLQYSPFYRVCRDSTDGRCKLVPATWALFYKVWKYLGLKPNDMMKLYKDIPETWSPIEVKLTDLGYQLHLKGVIALIRKKIDPNDATASKMVKTLISRQPANPFFSYLKEGPSKQVKDKVLKYCPKKKNGTNFRKFQWSWERETSEEAWRESMGWECIFMANLLNVPNDVVTVWVKGCFRLRSLNNNYLAQNNYHYLDGASDRKTVKLLKGTTHGTIWQLIKTSKGHVLRSMNNNYRTTRYYLDAESNGEKVKLLDGTTYGIYWDKLGNNSRAQFRSKNPNHSNYLDAASNGKSVGIVNGISHGTYWNLEKVDCPFSALPGHI